LFGLRGSYGDECECSSFGLNGEYEMCVNVVGLRPEWRVWSCVMGQFAHVPNAWYLTILILILILIVDSAMSPRLCKKDESMRAC
jgi:hypothetical protein